MKGKNEKAPEPPKPPEPEPPEERFDFDSIWKQNREAWDSTLAGIYAMQSQVNQIAAQNRASWDARSAYLAREKAEAAASMEHAEKLNRSGYSGSRATSGMGLTTPAPTGGKSLEGQ